MPNYPAGFDHNLNPQIDQIARAIAPEMQIQPDVDRWEYGALIWVIDKRLYRSTIDRGKATSVPMAKLWAQVDWQSHARVVAIVHSHPRDQQVGSEDKPVWTKRPNSDTLSSPDFNNLLDHSGRTVGHDAAKMGFDPITYRSYLVTKTGIKKYFGFDQVSSYNSGGQATWAVPATDS